MLSRWLGAADAIRLAEETRVHHSCGRRGDGVAARGAGAARRRSCRLSDSRAQPRLRPKANVLPLLCADCANSGWIEGRTVGIEVRWAEGRDERFANWFPLS